MEFRKEFIFILIAEVFFLGLVAALVGLLINRRKLRKERERSAALNNEIATIRQRLELTHQHLQSANNQIKALSNTSSKNDPLLLNYQQRIANLEKFKELYFELEDRLAQVSGDLKASNDVAIEVTESDRYKERVRVLEANEARLQQELIGYTRRIQELEARQSSKPYGAVRVREVDELSDRLHQRESEIRRLRQECETIGLQYEELAAKSLEIVSSREDLTDDQKAQLENLRRMLEENAAALARKQAECEMLENCYLELENNAQSGEAEEQLQQSQVECNALNEKRLNLGSQVEQTLESDAAEELIKLRQELANKEALLSDVREEYKEIKEQFVEVAQEQDELRKSNELLKHECEKLRHELEELNAVHLEVASQQKELEKLRSEYSKMESRYVALVEKQR